MKDGIESVMGAIWQYVKSNMDLEVVEFALTKCLMRFRCVECQVWLAWKV